MKKSFWYVWSCALGVAIIINILSMVNVMDKARALLLGLIIVILPIIVLNMLTIFTMVNGRQDSGASTGEGGGKTASGKGSKFKHRPVLYIFFTLLAAWLVTGIVAVFG